MKKLMFAAIAIVAMCAFVAPANAEKMMFGVKAGVNMADVSGDDAGETSGLTAFAGGVFMNYQLSEIFAIQPELLYSQKGTTATMEIDDVSGEFEWKTDYFEIPVLLKVNIPTEGKIKPALYAGPAFGFLMSAKLEDVDVKDDLESMDIGVLAGGEIGYAMEKGLLSLEVRYEVGMATILKPEEDYEPDVKNSVLSIMLGYGFAF